MQLTEVVAEMMKEVYGAINVSFMKLVSGDKTCVYADLTYPDGRTECVRVGHQHYINMMSNKFNLNRKLFHKSYEQLCNEVTDILDLYNVTITEMQNIMTKFSGDDVFYTKNLRALVKRINSEYDTLRGMKVEYDVVIEKLFNKGFIASKEPIKVWIYEDSRVLPIFVCKNALNTDKRIMDVLTPTVNKESRSYNKQVDNGYIGITSTDVVYTLTTSTGSVLSTTFKDGSIHLTDIINTGMLNDHIISKDKRFMDFLETINRRENHHECYLLQFHWDISNKKASKAIRRERNETRSRQFKQSRMNFKNHFM